jgi:hypothetical protein
MASASFNTKNIRKTSEMLHKIPSIFAKSKNNSGEIIFLPSNDYPIVCTPCKSSMQLSLPQAPRKTQKASITRKTSSYQFQA